MKAKTVYECGICGSEFGTESEAQACEDKGTDPPVVRVGDIVFLGAGFGWFDGDEAWVSNPGVRTNLDGTGLTASQVRPPRPCPEGDANCFSECCTYKFYYVVTHIDSDSRDPHRTRYHVETMAMTGKQGYRSGYTFNEHHVTPKLVKDPPIEVVEQGQKLVGNRARYLL